MNRAKRAHSGAACLAVLGTGSDVGKSVVVTALCRIFNDLGIRVAPFKAQNMSNNSFVTALGEEIGRAQAAQAEAARVSPEADMNPVLLKPCSDTEAQIVLHGKPLGNRRAGEYYASTDELFRESRASLNRLRTKHDLVILEGAGSCVEVNLRRRDFVNFRMAHAAGAPVILVADIDRGGVFAQLIGTLDVIPRRDRDRVRGILINRFRGDPLLFRDGIDYIRRRTRVPFLGLIPYYHHLEIDSEDGLPLDAVTDPPGPPAADKVNIAVLRLPHISNFTDFAPLGREPVVSLSYLYKPRSLEGYDWVIFPGSKNVRADREWLARTGWDRHLRDFRYSGGRLTGICGGYQMLGRIIRDADGMDGEPGETSGLGFLDVETDFLGKKALHRIRGFWAGGEEAVDGYEIHMGRTRGPDEARPAIRVSCRDGEPVAETDGAVSSDGRVWGTYLHGVFDLSGFRSRILEELRSSRGRASTDLPGCDEPRFRDRQYDLLAAHFRAHMDLPLLLEIAGFKEKGGGFHD